MGVSNGNCTASARTFLIPIGIGLLVAVGKSKTEYSRKPFKKILYITKPFYTQLLKIHCHSQPEVPPNSTKLMALPSPFTLDSEITLIIE